MPRVTSSSVAQLAQIRNTPKNTNTARERIKASGCPLLLRALSTSLMYSRSVGSALGGTNQLKSLRKKPVLSFGPYCWSPDGA